MKTFTLLLALLLLTGISVIAQVNRQDSLALVDLYDSTGGANWNDNNGWLTKAPVSTWDNINLDSASVRVNSINLSSNKLVGKIPNSIGNLTQLQNLDLSYNNLSGSIPNSIGNLSNAINIFLSNNNLIGNIPDSVSKLTNLQTLDVSYNELSSFSATIFQSLPNLSGSLENNNFTFSGLEQLLTFLPQNNSYTYSPQNNISLRRVGNKLSVSVGGTPSYITYNWYNNSVLVARNIGDSNFTIPSSGSYYVLVNDSAISQLTLYSDTFSVYYPNNKLDSLALVDLYDSTNGANWVFKTNWLTTAPINSWAGVVTDTLGRVIELELNSNSLTGTIPFSIGNLSDLNLLSITGSAGYYNSLKGTIPNSIGRLVNLKTLDLSGNQLTGPLPDSIGNLVSLNSLDLEENPIADTLPSSIGNLSSLQGLNLVACNLIGSIPASIGNLYQLNSLDLSFNNLTGSIPVSIGNLINLVYLELEQNHLAGSIPTSIGNLTNLYYLDFDSNNISDTIPSSIGNMVHLNTLNFGSNQLSGSLPKSMGNMTDLNEIDLYNNKLSGNLPASLANLDSLSFIDIRNNQLNGNLPSWIGACKSLIDVDLSNNQLSGIISDSFCNSSTLSNLNLNQNKLTGISDSIGKLSNLNTLYLSHNQIKGSIPLSIGNLTGVGNLDLSYNQLSGSIPDTLRNLQNLANLHLNNNYLIGTIPNNLGNLMRLDTLDFSNNELSGDLPSCYDTIIPIIILGTGNHSKIGNFGLPKNPPESCQYCYPNGSFQIQVFKVNNNRYNFTAAEEATNIQAAQLTYAPQSTVPLNKNGNQLFFPVGGTPANNTFKWFRNDTLVATIKNDSTYTMTVIGKFWSIATDTTQLTLYSDTINVTTLPIKEINIEAKETNGKVLVLWQTATELNTSHFIIQHSTEGTSFTNIGTVKAIGSGANSYSFTDTHPTNGINYYRLESVDKDGAASYSKVVSVQVTVNSNQLTVYPNPSKEAVTIKGNHIVSVQMIDNMGRVVKVVSLKDATNPSLSVSNLPAGVYHLRIQTTDGNVSGVGVLVN